MRIILTFILTGLISFTSLNSQRNCGAMEVLERQLRENPEMLQNMEEIERQVEEYLRTHPTGHGERVVITIPTVFHVLYRTTTENISDAQIMTQLDVLNQDFSATNGDIGLTPALFSGLVANAEIQFCLATQTPTGGATTGITRKSTTVSAWGTNDSVKKSSQGGVDPWDASKYLNIWICNIGGGILGYAQFPGGSAATDGVVLDYRYTGTIGTATAPFNKGRTGTHEVGHWLNLRHIWGDATCGSDLVSDTPVHNTSNYGCPAYPHYSTCTGTPVEMTMNYMDYTDDACMYMFSAGQKTRMRAVLEGLGARASLATSPGCSPPSGGGGTCNAPTNLAASSVTASSAVCSWAAVSGAASYTFEYKTNAATTWTVINTSGNSTLLSGLSASTTYNTRVKTNCSSGSSAYSTTVNFTTLASSGTCTDNYESNNTKSASKTITPGTSINATIGTSTDVDWFKFANTTSQKNIKVTMTNLAADYDMILYRSNTQVGISENTGTANEQILYNNTQSATTYYLKVYGYNGAFSASQCYNLLAQISGSSFRTASGEIEEVTPVTGEFLVFPNPAANEVSLVLPFGKGGEGTLTIMDITGKVLFNQDMKSEEADETHNLDITGFKPGLYLVNFRTGKMNYTQKLAVSDNR